MTFVFSPPWWLAAVVAAAIGAMTYAQYRRPLAPLTRGRRAALVACRAAVLLLLVALLFRPTIAVAPRSGRAPVVPVLVDRSLSMRVNDAGGRTRLAQAVSLAGDTIIPALSKSFRPEVFAVGQGVEPAVLDGLAPDAPASNLGEALVALRDRYRGQRVAGIVVLSDGAGTDATSDVPGGGPPVFAVGVGSTEAMADREVTGILAGEQRIDRASIDLQVTTVSSGFGRAPFGLRVLANGVEIERRRIAPAADGAPVTDTFTVAPDSARPTVYTAQIVADAGDTIPENDVRSVLVNPAGRRRRLLVILGAPGFEHSFITRAWASDDGLEVDAVGRKGRNAEGQDTFFVQADASRATGLTRGFPARLEDLYAYDAVVLANVDGDFLTRAQLAMIAQFVSARGGGLLVLGGRSFGPGGLSGTALEEALPIQVSDGRGAAAATLTTGGAPADKVILTADGDAHPVMRIGESREDTRRRWAALPPLAAIAPVGGPRAGATVLAVASGPTGAAYPVVAVQRYGRGRSMTFSGEASWRWKMLLPSTDRSFDVFWRQAARYVAGTAPDPVALAVPEAASPGAVQATLDVRDAAFGAVDGAVVSGTITTPEGESRPLRWRQAGRGRYVAGWDARRPGLYHLSAEATRGSGTLGSADRWMYVGGVDAELADPRLNEGWLRRVARASGGRYVRADAAAQVASWVRDVVPEESAAERRDLWHEPWTFVLVVMVLTGEWVLRRRWGLR